MFKILYLIRNIYLFLVNWIFYDSYVATVQTVKTGTEKWIIHSVGPLEKISKGAWRSTREVPDNSSGTWQFLRYLICFRHFGWCHTVKFWKDAHLWSQALFLMYFGGFRYTLFFFLSKNRPDQNEAQIFSTFFILRLKIFLKNGDFRPQLRILFLTIVIWASNIFLAIAISEKNVPKTPFLAFLALFQLFFV